MSQIRGVAKVAVAVALSVCLASCGTYQQSIKPNGAGYLTTGQGQPTRAHTVTAQQVKLVDYKPLALVTGSEYALQQLRDVGYFTEVIDLDELQKRVVARNLQDKIPSLSDRIGISNAGRNFGKFLWVYFKRDKRDNQNYLRLVATDPATLNDLFVAEVEVADIPGFDNYSDQKIRYPLFNSLIDWIRAN